MRDISILHNSHVSAFRSPFGAVSCTDTVVLRLKVIAVGAIKAELRTWQDEIGEIRLPMTLVQEEAGTSTYEVSITAPEKPGLLWYYFIVSHAGAVYYYGNNPKRQGGVGEICTDRQPPSYQITVSKQQNTTPAWLKEAVIYQIFIDRFYNGEADERVLNPKPGSMIHASWQDTPYYIRDPETKRIVSYDFFGGNLRGVLAKLPYLKELGITAIYFNPLFQSASNHRYDTGDYHLIDPMIGDNALFTEFCTKARAAGIAVILDGVFSHTGSDSRYFNKEGNYPGLGAYQSTASPYYPWYRFQQHPDKYESWWGIDALPNVEETEPSYIDFMLTGKNSVIKHWLRAGAKGWRLDVVDELPDSFVKELYRTVKEYDSEAVVIGEVWEDASNKKSYNQAREYLGGEELDSVMNYPFRQIVLDYLLGSKDGHETWQSLYSLYENYPRQHFYAMMNLIGSHDVMRISTLLGEAPAPETLTVVEQKNYRLPPEKRKVATARLKLAALFQMTFPGAPAIYYGDEVGMEGYKDPFNRGPYPWGRADTGLLNWYKSLIALRQEHPLFRTGEWLPVCGEGDVFGYIRYICGGRDVFDQPREDGAALIFLNRGNKPSTVTVAVHPWLRGTLLDGLNGKLASTVKNGLVKVTLKPLEGKILLQATEKGLPRQAGMLVHPTSLPSRYGIGDCGKASFDFINFLHKAGQKIWQILPLNPPGYGNSPYQCVSAFAGNPLLIAPGKLVSAGLVTAAEAGGILEFPVDKVDYAAVTAYKENLLRKAFARFEGQTPSKDYQIFIRENNGWLGEYALFMALKGHFDGAAWTEWPREIAVREAAALAKWRNELAAEIDYYSFIQYLFFSQWLEVKRYAERWGIQIIGDLPIFVAHDSADVWANQAMFKLDKAGHPAVVAGVPPDYFSPTGQRWGNPHYNWAAMAKDGYAWWRERLVVLLRQVHMIRVDHFRGFEAAWEIPAREKTAVKGKWVKGPGASLFAAIEQHLGKLPLIAEDLGVITPAVDDLKHSFGLPGMQILQFALTVDSQQRIIPFRPERNSVTYTGTHDNDTTVGWYEQLVTNQPQLAGAICRYLGLTENASAQEVCRQMVELAYASNSNTAIIPLQDILQLDGKTRMNLPGSTAGNWRWRCRPGVLTAEIAVYIADLAKKSKR